MTSTLHGLIDELDLGQYREHLTRVARASIELRALSDPPTAGGSRFGGWPDVPETFVWPRHPLGWYRFIGQIRLADVPRLQDGLPRQGLLSFFYAHDDDGEVFWQDPDYVRVFCFGDDPAPRPLEPPEPVRFGSTVALGCEPGLDVPPWPMSEPLDPWPIPESLGDAYWELRRQLHPSRRYLLGYPRTSTLAYDPTPGPDWCSLLTVFSDDDLEWCWHDGDWLVTFIERARLLQSDFSEIKADAG